MFWCLNSAFISVNSTVMELCQFYFFLSPEIIFFIEVQRNILHRPKKKKKSNQQRFILWKAVVVVHLNFVLDLLKLWGQSKHSLKRIVLFTIEKKDHAQDWVLYRATNVHSFPELLTFFSVTNRLLWKFAHLPFTGWSTGSYWKPIGFVLFCFFNLYLTRGSKKREMPIFCSIYCFKSFSTIIPGG